MLFVQYFNQIVEAIKTIFEEYFILRGLKCKQIWNPFGLKSVEVHVLIKNSQIFMFVGRLNNIVSNQFAMWFYDLSILDTFSSTL